MGNSAMEQVLASPWGETEPTLRALRGTPYWTAFWESYGLLDRSVLYESRMHGAEHIERVMLLSAILAWKGGFSPAATERLLLAASYHDIGRVDDSRDYAHGRRGAEMLSSDPRLACRMAEVTGEDRRALLAAVEAHSLCDTDRNSAAVRWGADAAPGSLFQRLATALKDADNLDRVRLGDLDEGHLRSAETKALVPFAEELYRRYLTLGEED